VQREWSVASSTYTHTNRGRKEGAEEGLDEWVNGVGGVAEGAGRDEWGGRVTVLFWLNIRAKITKEVVLRMLEMQAEVTIPLGC
jgi:hypothetical protein